MDENWYAFCIAILKNVTPEKAFQLYRAGKSSRKNTSIKQEDVLNMIKLKSQGWTYKKIGELYNLSSQAVCKRIKYYQKKHQK